MSDSHDTSFELDDDLSRFQQPDDRAQPAPYLDALNDEQAAAVTSLDGPTLVLAGAGTGKTRVLTTRLAHILATRRAYPGQILAVTFTNKAAREMKERIGQLIGSVVEGMQWLGTFHSIGAKILRQHAELVDLNRDFTILDTDDQIRLIKQILRAENIDEKRWPARQLAGMIDSWKNKGQTPKLAAQSSASDFANGRSTDLYAMYQARLRALNAVDFGDLILESLNLLKDNPDVLAQYHRRFRYIMVDEYQDTNVGQYLWLRLLAQAHKNICCVGDDDQSIYGWRGAEVDNILKFEKDFPGAKIIRLERNYRSTPHILAAASGLIASNKSRLGKTLWTQDEGGEKLQLKSYWDGEEEAREIADTIEDFQRKDHALNQIAILVRASFQMREFEDRFITLGLPYRVIGGPRFYERAEIRDALAYLRIVHNRTNDLALERIINKPKRGIGDATVQLIHAHGRQQDMPLFHAASELSQTDEIKGRARKSLTWLVQSIERWATAAASTPHTELAEIILDESGYTEMWQNDRSADAPGRLENLKELVRSMEQFENLGGFLEHVSLVMEAEQSDATDKVTLMTLHAAKGLEFDTVFLPGWEEGLFPHQRSLDESGEAGLEEERRLAYVGITRARKNVLISHAANRRIHALWQSSLPSRFVEEIPADHIDIDETPGSNPYARGGQSSLHNRSSFSSDYGSPGWRRAQIVRERNALPPTPVVIDEQGELVATNDPSAASFAIGERVFHQKFGYGHVLDIDGNKLTVDFEKTSTKKVIDTFLEKT